MITTRLPRPRGPLTDELFARLRSVPAGRPIAGGNVVDPFDDDAQLALYVLQELAYRPVGDVDDRWEHDPGAVTLRLGLERELETALRERTQPVTRQFEDAAGHGLPDALTDALTEMVAGAEGPSLSKWVAAHAGVDHLAEFAVHRAPYQLKEADPHSTAIPRLAAGPVKSALLDIQLDEYGPQPGEAHAQLFAGTMRALGLEPDAGPDLDRLPATTLVTSTTLHLLAGCRRLIGALLGHLAVFEMTSVAPMYRYGAALRRVLPESDAAAAARFYDVHVAADGRHQHVALDDMIGPFVCAEPERAGDVLFGAAAVLAVEADFAGHVLDAWQAGRSSLRQPLPGSRLRPPSAAPAPLRLVS